MSSTETRSATSARRIASSPRPVIPYTHVPSSASCGWASKSSVSNAPSQRSSVTRSPAWNADTPCVATSCAASARSPAARSWWIASSIAPAPAAQVAAERWSVTVMPGSRRSSSARRKSRSSLW